MLLASPTWHYCDTALLPLRAERHPIPGGMAAPARMLQRDRNTGWRHLGARESALATGSGQPLAGPPCSWNSYQTSQLPPPAALSGPPSTSLSSNTRLPRCGPAALPPVQQRHGLARRCHHALALPHLSASRHLLEAKSTCLTPAHGLKARPACAAVPSRPRVGGVALRELACAAG